MQLGGTISERTIERQRASLVVETGLAAPPQVDYADAVHTAEEKVLPLLPPV